MQQRDFLRKKKPGKNKCFAFEEPLPAVDLSDFPVMSLGDNTLPNVLDVLTTVTQDENYEDIAHQNMKMLTGISIQIQALQ